MNLPDSMHEGQRRYGTLQNSGDRPPTESELMKIHVEERHGGRMTDCSKCDKYIS